MIKWNPSQGQPIGMVEEVCNTKGMYGMLYKDITKLDLEVGVLIKYIDWQLAKIKKENRG